MLNAIWAVMILLAVVYGAFTGHLSDVTNAALDSAGEAVSLCITMAGVVALWTGLMEIAQRAGLVRKLTSGIAPFLRFLFPRIPKGHPAEGYIATNVIANVLGLGWACTPAGLKAMEELAKLEAQRGNPEYLAMESRETYVREPDYAQELSEGKGVNESKMPEREPKKRFAGQQRSLTSGYGRLQRASEENSGRRGNDNRGRRASNEMCIFLILNISSLQLIPVNMIAYRSQYGSANPTAIIAPAIAATLVSTLVAIVYCKIKDAGAGRRMSGNYGSGYERNVRNTVSKEYFRADKICGNAGEKKDANKSRITWKEDTGAGAAFIYDGKSNPKAAKTGNKGGKAV